MEDPRRIVFVDLAHVAICTSRGRPVRCVTVIAAGLLWGCGDPDPPGLLDASVDAQVDAVPGCARPDLEASWVRTQLVQNVAALTATPRFLGTERNAARTYLSSQLSSMGWTPQRQPYPGGENVLATIPATMGNGKLIVIGAHFDTVSGSPGANDNASGVAVVLAVARYLHDTPCRRSPVVAVFFDQEETGLFGSRAYAQTLVPANVHAVHTIDQVAWDADGDSRFELELPTSALEAEWRAAATVVGVNVITTTTSGTDHQAFRDRGIATIGLTEEYVGGDSSPHRHTSGDTAASVGPYTNYMVAAAKLAAAVVLEEVSP